MAFFESRMAGPTADLIAKHGGVPLSAPALREIPLGDSPEVTAFAEQLVAGEFDVVIFETGVGVRYLAQAIETRMPRETWLEALARIQGRRARAQAGDGVARVASTGGPARAVAQHLARNARALDTHLPVAGLRVAVQEYGKPNIELVEGLEQRGATVTRVSVYRWALPEDLGPLRAAIVEIAQGRVGIALFTSAQQVEHLLHGRRGRGSRGRSPHCVRDLHHRRVDRSDDLGNPPRTRPAGRYRAGTPQAGPPHFSRRRRLARHGQGRIELKCSLGLVVDAHEPR